MIRIIDASVAIKFFAEEDGAKQARTLIAESDPLIAPDLLLAEVLNAGWRLTRSRLLTPVQFDAMIRRLPTIMSEFVPISELTERTADICRALDHPAYDCFYVALAEARDCELVTADRRLLQRLQGSTWAARVRNLYDLPAA